MKKLFLMSAFALMGVAANASNGMGVSTSCGKQVMTVGPECFTDLEDLTDYLEEINVAYCGEEGKVHAKVR